MRIVVEVLLNLKCSLFCRVPTFKNKFFFVVLQEKKVYSTLDYNINILKNLTRKYFQDLIKRRILSLRSI